MKVVVGQILLALEAQNPTRSPATSPLLNGKWKFLYATGASPGLKALQTLLRGSRSAPKSPSGADLIDVQDTFLTIGPEQPRATAEVSIRLFSFENTLKLSTRLEAESAVRLVEMYEAAESEYGSLRLPFKSPLQYKRSVLISYLDDDMLVVRDALGRPDVLVRVGLTDAWAPSSNDGDSVGEGNDEKHRRSRANETESMDQDDSMDQDESMDEEESMDQDDEGDGKWSGSSENA